MAEMNTHLPESFGSMSAQMAKFTAQRIEEGEKVQYKLFDGKSPVDIQNIQLKFF